MFGGGVLTHAKTSLRLQLLAKKKKNGGVAVARQTKLHNSRWISLDIFRKYPGVWGPFRGSGTPLNGFVLSNNRDFVCRELLLGVEIRSFGYFLPGCFC